MWHGKDQLCHLLAKLALKAPAQLDAGSARRRCSSATTLRSRGVMLAVWENNGRGAGCACSSQTIAIGFARPSSCTSTRSSNVAAVSTGVDLVEAVLAVDPDVIVSDVSMPLMTGPEALTLLRRAGCRSAFVLVTARSR